MSPYNSWCKEEAIEVCVAVWLLFQYPLLQTWEHRVHHYLQTVGKGWFMKPTSSAPDTETADMDVAVGTVIVDLIKSK